MLTAATFAAHAQPTPGKHDNFLDFKDLKKSDPVGSYPNLDDLFLWKYHRLIRKYQKRCLENHLGSLLPALIGRQAFPIELGALQTRFSDLCQAELQDMRRDHGRIDMRRTVGWTYWFHAGLQREYAWGEAINRVYGPKAQLKKVCRDEWYMPLSAHPSWAAWAVVFELAIRELLPEDRYPVEAPVPTILFQRDDHWESLRLEMGGYQRSGGRAPGACLAGLETTWELSALGSKLKDELPYNDSSKPFGRRRVSAPSANQIWDIAAFRLPIKDADEEDRRQFKSDRLKFVAIVRKPYLSSFKMGTVESGK